MKLNTNGKKKQSIDYILWKVKEALSNQEQYMSCLETTCFISIVIKWKYKYSWAYINDHKHRNNLQAKISMPTSIKKNRIEWSISIIVCKSTYTLGKNHLVLIYKYSLHFQGESPLLQWNGSIYKCVNGFWHFNFCDSPFTLHN